MGNAKVFAEMDKQLQQLLENCACDWEQSQGTFALYQDPPGITSEDHLRLSLGVQIHDQEPKNPKMESLLLPEGNYLEGDFLLSAQDYGQAWEDLYFYHLPSRNLEPGDGPGYERYLQDCWDPISGKTRVILGLPVQRAII